MLNPNLFQNPPAKYRIHPFWFWNGDLDEEQIELQVSEMAAKGIGGFFPSPRQGMTIPYLSEAWFAKIKFAVQVAEKYHLDVWLYDEYPYPSGIAGGEVVLEHPDAKHYTLEHRKAFVKNNEELILDLPWGRTVSATAVSVDPITRERNWGETLDISEHIGNFQTESVFQKTGLTAYNNKRYFSYQTIKKLQWTAPAGEWEVHIFLEAEISDYKYYGTFVDPGHEEAMRTFIQLTHERYKKTVGEYFGKTIKGMFTDEIGYLGRYPWSTRLAEFFLKQNSYSLKDHLQALDDSRYPGAAKIRYDFFQAANILLRESYHKQVHDWCVENGLEYVAEVPALRMSTQLYSHVVGSDSAHEKLGRSLDWVINHSHPHFRSNTKAASSLARQLGRERALCECFHSIGWSMTLQDAKWMIDRMAATGINFFNFHSFFYTVDGLTKHDAPPSQFIQAPYWKYFRELADYVGRISYVMSEGTAVIPIALLDPTTSFWTQMGNPMNGTVHEVSYVGNDAQEKNRLERLKSDWVTLLRELLVYQRDYDHLDPELLKEAEVQNGQLQIGKAVYSVLILPPMSNLETDAWKKIKEFLAVGGTVIAIGMLPYETIASDSPSEAEVLELFGMSQSTPSLYWGDSNDSASVPPWVKGKNNAYFITSSSQNDWMSRLLQLLNELEPAKVQLGTGQNRSFLMQSRSIVDSFLVFVTNQEEKEWELPLLLNRDLLKGLNLQDNQVVIRELDLETGQVNPISFESTVNNWMVSLHFAPWQSHLIEIFAVPQDQKKEAATREVEWNLELSAQDAWEIQPNQLNLVRLDTFELNLSSEKGPSRGAKVTAKTFIDQCSDLAGHHLLPIEFKQFFGTPMKMNLSYPIQCTYKTQFEVQDLSSVCELLMDRGAISGNYTIYLNNHKVTASEFHPQFVYDHLNQTCDIQKYLKLGENSLHIEVEITKDWDGVVDPIYLRGNFGVQFNRNQTPVIAAAPTLSSLHGGPYTGFPYYSGTFSFKQIINLSEVPPNPTFKLSFKDLDEHFHDCAEVLINGQSLGVRAWIPYSWQGNRSIWRVGENTIEVLVTNTLIGTLEGKYFDYGKHQLINVTD